MKLSLSQWLFYSLEALSITLVVVGCFGRQLLSKLKWGASHVKWTSLRPSSNWRSPSSQWLSSWKNEWKGYTRAAWVWGVCLFAILAFASVPFSNRLGKHPLIRRDWVYFVRPVGDYGYDVLWAEDSYETAHYIIICHSLGFEPPFDSGEVAQWVQYRDLGDCWDMRAIPSWDMLRDGERNLTLMNEEEFRSWRKTEKATLTQ